MKNENGKFEDLIQLHKDQVLTTFETLLIHELRVLNDSINGDHEETLVKKLSCIHEEIEDLTDEIRKGFENITSSIYDK